MKVLELLSRCRNGAADIDRLRKQLDRRQKVAEEVGKTEENNAAMLRLINLISRRTERRTAELSAACALLDRLPELDGDVLYWYYVERQTIEEIAAASNYCKRHVQRVKQRAELTLRQIPENEIAALLPESYEWEDNDEDR